MEFLETVQIRGGRYCEFFPGAVESRLLVWHFHDLFRICDDCVYRRAEAVVWGPGGRLGVLDLRDYFCGRYSAVLPGNYGAVYCKDLYGIQASTDFYSF